MLPSEMKKTLLTDDLGIEESMVDFHQTPLTLFMSIDFKNGYTVSIAKDTVSLFSTGFDIDAPFQIVLTWLNGEIIEIDNINYKMPQSVKLIRDALIKIKNL